MSNIVDLEEYRINNSPNYAKVGDIVEWEDYDGEIYTSKVKSIGARGIDQYFPVDVADLRFNDSYIFIFDDGFSVAGFVVRRKILPKRKVV